MATKLLPPAKVTSLPFNILSFTLFSHSGLLALPGTLDITFHSDLKCYFLRKTFPHHPFL